MAWHDMAWCMARQDTIVGDPSMQYTHHIARDIHAIMLSHAVHVICETPTGTICHALLATHASTPRSAMYLTLLVCASTVNVYTYTPTDCLEYGLPVFNQIL